ncbi:hypothetical protein [Eggerthella sinensis]|uniref:hypothetical protein n=1 Tax=Eggerthella sinensis TaxID=242230 RepID=UPI001D0842D6|nr:hypothetical protein [Eggerthella sinensis]MCB7038285.1 hypothetical protein [Eggerthella sinensis]
MSGSQKALKIISIIMIVWAIVVILLGAFMAAGSAVPGVSSETIDTGDGIMNMSTAALAFGIGTIVGGVINLIIGLLGLRGAKNPRKVGAFFVMCIIGLIFGIAGLVLDIMNGALAWSDIVSVLIVVVCTCLAQSIKKQA